MLAATRLIPMRKNKGKSIGACLHNHTSYIQNPDKTEQGELVSSYQCSPLTVDEEFLSVSYTHLTLPTTSRG